MEYSPDCTIYFYKHTSVLLWIQVIEGTGNPLAIQVTVVVPEMVTLTERD